MKKVSFLFFLILFTAAFAQKSYEFDFAVKYSVKNESDGEISESVSYFNSDNPNYYLKLFSVGNGMMKCRLYDRLTGKVHQFKVTETKQGKEIISSFEYIFTVRNFVNIKPPKNTRFEFSELNSNRTKLSIFTRKNQKKPEHTYDLTLKPANKDLFFLSRMVFMHPYNFTDALNFPGNYIVEKAVYRKGKVECKFELKEYKNVYLEIRLPEKLKSPD